MERVTASSAESSLSSTSIYEVDGTSTYGLNLTEAVALIKGPEGTSVELTLLREGERDYKKLTLTRRKVESPTVES